MLRHCYINSKDAAVETRQNLIVHPSAKDGALLRLVPLPSCTGANQDGGCCAHLRSYSQLHDDPHHSRPLWTGQGNMCSRGIEGRASRAMNAAAFILPVGQGFLSDDARTRFWPSRSDLIGCRTGYIPSPEPVNIPLWVYGCGGVFAMKTTVEVPDDLYRRAKAEAALRGRKLKDLVEEGLRLVIEKPHKTSRHLSLAELMKHARGVTSVRIRTI